MYRITIMGRDLKEFQENLLAYADIHRAMMNENKVNRKLTKVEVESEEDVEEEMIEVESPFTETQPVLNEANKLEDSQAVDSEGYPWDERIHASSKALNADGTWRNKRNVDKDLVAKIKSQVKVKTPQNTTVVNPPLAEVPPVIQTPVVVAPPPAPPVNVSGGHTLETFSANFPLILGTLITEGKVKQDYVNELKKFFGVAEIWMINEEQKAQVFESFVQHNLITRVG